MASMLRAQELMTPRPRTVRRDAPLITVLDLMVKDRIEHVPVCDDAGHLLGIVSDRDLKSSLPDRTRPRSQFEDVVRRVTSEEIMTQDPITVLPECPLADAIALMLSCRVGALPVVEHGVLVGILTQADVLRRYAEDLATRRLTRDLNQTGTIDIDVELGPPRVFALSADQKARGLVTTPLVDAGYMVQSFESLPEMMAVWHLVLPDLLIVDKSYESNPNLRIVLRSKTPVLWLDSGFDRIELTGDNIERLEIPCSDAVLIRLVQGVIGSARMTKDMPSSEPSHPRVLIAEDDHVIRRILQHHLTRHGYELFEANDGREAQHFLDDKDPFDLILLDINMPYFSGLDLLKRLKEHPRPPKRVILSASHRDETVMKAFALGADDFVKKPFNPEVLIRRLDRLLARA